MKPDRDLLDKLKAVPLFGELSDHELADLSGQGRIVDHEGGADVVEAGGSAVGFHLILEGTASVLQAGKLLAQLGPGDYFGEISLIDGKPRTATVRTDTAMRTFSITAWLFQPMLAHHPALAHNLLLGLCARLRAAEAKSSAL